MKKRKLPGRDVVCPYFLREEACSVSCEGWVKRTTIKWTFVNAEEKKQYMAKRCKCMGEYKRCLVAAVLERKYRKE